MNSSVMIILFFHLLYYVWQYDDILCVEFQCVFFWYSAYFCILLWKISATYHMKYLFSFELQSTVKPCVSGWQNYWDLWNSGQTLIDKKETIHNRWTVIMNNLTTNFGTKHSTIFTLHSNLGLMYYLKIVNFLYFLNKNPRNLRFLTL